MGTLCGMSDVLCGGKRMVVMTKLQPGRSGLPSRLLRDLKGEWASAGK